MSSSESLSTRLFPKGQGADQMVLTGLSRLCDWVICSDGCHPEIDLRMQVVENPKTIFLSLRHPFVAIEYFATSLLPSLTAPFVLVSGSEDVTIPLQCDSRWRPFTSAEDGMILQIATSPLLRRWYAENLDWPFAPALRPLPLGLVPSAIGQSPLLPEDNDVPPALKERQLNVLCAHRLREGPQWGTRQRLSQVWRSRHEPWLITPDEDIPEPEFMELLRRCSFVACVSGGGWDPCPKLWHALIHGAIPIVRRSSLDPLLVDLPVWIVDDWHSVDLSLSALEAKRTEMARRMLPYRELLHRLSLAYWWSQIHSDI